MSNIQVIKLTTGEDLIGEISDTEIEGKAFLVGYVAGGPKNWIAKANNFLPKQ